MKKVILFLVVAVSLAACEGPMGPQGFDGKDGKDAGTTWFTKTITVQPNEWELVGETGELDSYFVANKQLSELTNFVYKDGAVIAYIETDNGMKNGMPFVLHRGEVGDNGKDLLWTETFDFDFSVGKVRFYLTYSDFQTQVKKKDPFTFHVVLMW